MANNGPFCKGIENAKGNIFESKIVGKTVNVSWWVSKVPQYILTYARDGGGFKFGFPER